MPEENPVPTGEIILYQTEDGGTRIECRFEDENVWLTQRLLAELYQVGVTTINHHIKEVFEDGELRSESTIRQYRIVQTEGTRQVERQVEHYNLQMILAVGFRVRTQRGVAFRQWAIANQNRQDRLHGFGRNQARQSGGNTGAIQTRHP